MKGLRNKRVQEGLIFHLSQCFERPGGRHNDIAMAKVLTFIKIRVLFCPMLLQDDLGIEAYPRYRTPDPDDQRLWWELKASVVLLRL